MKIKNIEINSKVILAPMAGVTSTAFRKMCLEMGAGLVYAEMVSDKGLTYHNKKTLDMTKILESEHPISMQLFGSDETSLLEAAQIVIKNSNVDIIDINMGCPVKKVVTSGAGSALLKTPEKIYDIVKTLTSNLDIPITIKIRLGWDNDHINALEIARLAEKAGASAIAIHGRTRSQMYNGNATYDIIKQIKQSINIPVIANGDINTPQKAKEVLDYTGCDAVMIGRAACGNPWIFKEISTYLEKGIIIPRPSKKEILDMMLLHAKNLSIYKGEHTALVEMRTHAAWYLKNFVGAKAYKVKVVSVNNFNELSLLAEEILNDEKIYVKNI